MLDPLHIAFTKTAGVDSEQHGVLEEMVRYVHSQRYIDLFLLSLPPESHKAVQWQNLSCH